MVARSERLQVVLSLEERKEQKALDEMTRARDSWQAELARFDELQNYQQEYHSQLRSWQQGKVTASRLQEWQAFISRLGELLQAQQRRVEQAEAAFETSRQGWQQAWERRRGMEKYIATCREQEQQLRDKAEQKSADEAAARQFARRR